MQTTLPKKLVPFVWAILVSIILVILPWIAARVERQLGWSTQTVAWWNFMGLIVVAIGLGLYVGSLVFHYRSYQSEVQLSFSPPHLVVAGPYRLSRNPMYIAGLLTWFGWTLFYGSPAVLLVMVLLWLIFNFRVIPQEERQLEALFGEEYLVYKRTVRRWFGRY